MEEEEEEKKKTKGECGGELKMNSPKELKNERLLISKEVIDRRLTEIFAGIRRNRRERKRKNR